MITLVTDSPYKFGENYEMVNDNLFKFFPVLSSLKRPLIDDIIKAVKTKKICLMYAKEDDDIRIIVPSKDNKTVYVNASSISSDLDRDIMKGNIKIGVLYSLMLQGYVMLHWDALSRNRELLAQALEAYGEIWIKVATNKGMGYFESPDIKNKFLFLTYWYALANTQSAVSDTAGYAGRISKYREYEVIMNKYKDYMKGPSLEQFLVNVLQEEFPFFKKIEDEKSIIFMVYRLFGPTAVSMIDDLKYFPPIAVDFTQTASLIVYKEFGGLTNIIDKKSFNEILTTISDF